MNTEQEKLLDQMAMLRAGNRGNTQAHIFLERVAREPLMEGENPRTYAVLNRFQNVRCFVPPKEQDRVLMFEDNSGVYVGSNGFCSVLSSDIRHEVVHMTEELK